MKRFTEAEINAISQELKSAGIKPSAQRIAILRYIKESRCHPTVDDIYRDLLPTYPTLSRTTVYNTAWLLAEYGTIATINIERGNVRFDYMHYPHAHFRCKKCGCIIDIPMEQFPSTDTLELESQTLHIQETSIYYEGLCQKCHQETYN
jgi:Fe2+ or Zn2+ uptake regulation protein